MEDLKKLLAEASIDGGEQLVLRLHKPYPDDSDGWLQYWHDYGWQNLCDAGPFGTINTANAALIVAAVNALPELLAERDRLSAERDALKALCHEASEHYGYGGTFPIRGLMAMRLIGAALGNLEPAQH